MKDFNTRKKEYLAEIESDYLLLQGIMGSKSQNTPEALELIFNPKTEGELNIAIATTTILRDTLEMFYNSEDFIVEDISKEVSVDLFRKIILALRDNNTRVLNFIREEVTAKANPESLGELAYNVMKVFTVNLEEAYEYLASQCGFNLFDEKSSALFKVYFERANNTLNQMLPTIDVNGKIDFANENLISYYSRLAKSFDKKYQEDREKNKKKVF